MAALLLMSACGGSARAEARTSGDVATFDFDRPLGEEELAEKPPEGQHDKAMQSLTQQGLVGAEPSGQTALLGARRDLRIAPSVTEARCQCLGVVLGPPDHPGFLWQGPRPTVNPTTQVVVGLTSEGVACDRNPKGHVASYKGYAVEGNDVVVTVEVAQAGRPVTQGAILPRPAGAGQIYVRPASGDVPFGRGPDGAPRCSVGQPAGR
jgi:hypothetical protein